MRTAPDMAPPRRRARRPARRSRPAPRPWISRRWPGRCCWPAGRSWRSRCHRPGHPGDGDRRRLPVHPEDPRRVLSAVATDAQADLHPAGLPGRRRHRRRPRRGAAGPGSTALPKATALTTYSYRLEHSRQAAFLAALDKAALAAWAGRGQGAKVLDFHAVMQRGQHRFLEDTTCPAGPSAPARCSPSSPKTPPPIRCYTPTPTCPKPARTARSSRSPTTGRRSPDTTRRC